MIEDEPSLTEPEMLKATFVELGQADLKAIGRSRGFGTDTMASPELMRHIFLSDQGVTTALASLTPVELAGLHLLRCLRRQMDLEFFTRVYPECVTGNRYGTYNERFKGLFQQVKRQLILRGLLLVATLPEFFDRSVTILERRRFRLPAAFGALLPLPFQTRQLDPGIKAQHRTEVLRDKVAELLRLRSAGVSQPAKDAAGRWRVEKGELFLGPRTAQFQVEHLLNWQRAQLDAAVGDTSKPNSENTPAIALIIYALAQLGADDWLAPDELLPLWKVGRSGAKGPDPKAVCEAAYEWGCVQRVELNGSFFYRLPSQDDREADTAPDVFFNADDPQHVGVRLDRMPLAALERLCQIARLQFTESGLHAVPDLLKLSHASAEALTNPIVTWLRGHHAGFRSTLEKIEQHRGKLIVHQNLLVARIKDLSLKVMLEKQFAGPGLLVALSAQFVAFPRGLLPEVRSWMKKSGHVIKAIQSGAPGSGEEEEDQEDE